ncbi:hypothetical protein GCM10020229_67080 [Kitasatospora albolonga]
MVISGGPPGPGWAGVYLKKGDGWGGVVGLLLVGNSLREPANTWGRYGTSTAGGRRLLVLGPPGGLRGPPWAGLPRAAAHPLASAFAVPAWGAHAGRALWAPGQT